MKSIGSKILAFAVLATLIPAIGLGVLSFWRYQQVVENNVAYELRTLADTASRELTLWERERVSEVRALSTSYTVIDAVTAVTKARSGTLRIGAIELELYLRSVQKRLDPLLELTVVDTKGRAIASSATTPAPVALPETWPNSAVTEGVIVAPPRWDATRAAATLTVVVPILSLKNELLGAMAAVLDLGTLQPQLKNIGKSGLAELILVGPDGTPLLASRTATAALTPLPPQTLQRLRAQPGAPQVFEGHHKRDVLGLAEAPRTVPIVVVAEADRANAYQGWLTTLKRFVALVAGLVVLVGIVAWWLSRAVARPLDRLTVAAESVASGDLSVHLPVVQHDEIGRLTRAFNRMTEQLRHGRAEVEAANAALRDQNQRLEALSVTDALTGLYNRSKLETILADQYARFRRNHRPFSVLMLDIDSFKAINDTHGHAAGDEVLVNLAQVLVQSVRAIDAVARYGGEEFVVVLVETGSDAALEVAERIRLLVQMPRYGEASGQLISVTASLGVAHSLDDDTGPVDVLARADQALYEAKHAGRNKVQRAT